MSPEEQFTQLIRTADQWKSGLAVRLNFVNIGGIELHSFPSFKNWIDELRNKKIGGVAIDECGQIYFVEHKSADLFLYEPGFKQTQRIFYHEFQESGRIILDEKSLYIVQKKEVRVYSRDSFQLKQIVNTKAEKQNRTVIEASDIAVDEQRNLYILDKKSGEILKRIVRDEFPRVFVKSLKEPLSIAVGKDNFLFVLDRQISGFLRFKEGSKPEIIGHFPKEFSPTILAAGLNGIIVAATESGLIHRFDADGSDLGKIEIPNFQGTISHIAIHRDGSIYISTDQGMAILGSQERVSKEEGIYYSRTLDSGIAQCQWHRLAFEADLPAHTLLKVHFYSSDETSFKRSVDRMLDDPKESVEKKVGFLERQMNWSKPEVFSFSAEQKTIPGSRENVIEAAKDTNQMLFRDGTKRYIWLKLALSTFNEKARPSVSEIRVYYPRISYLRYLPATYQENPASRDFLERFLSLFESVSADLETKISNIFRHFDVASTTEPFLKYLASWLNVALEEEWPEEKKRLLIQRASRLYERKGTPAGIQEFIEIYTGKRPVILEHSVMTTPMVLNNLKSRLGVNSVLHQTPFRGFRLGDDSILGKVLLRSVSDAPQDPFLSLAHRFTVLLNVSTDEFRKYEKGIIRILDAEKPAHTQYTLRHVGEMRLGIGMYVELSRIADYRPFEIGKTIPIGRGIVVGRGELVGRVEQHSRLEIDTELV